MSASMDGPHSPEPSVRQWLLTVALPCVATVVGLLLAIGVFESHYRPIGKAHQRTVERRLLKRVKRWANSRARVAPPVVLMADSLGICFDSPEGAQDRIAGQIRRRLNGLRPPLGVLDLTHPGLRPLQFFTLLRPSIERPASPEDRARQRPARALVIIEINLRLFRDRSPEADGGAARLPQLARYLTLRQAWMVRRDLAEEGLTILDPFIMRIKNRVGLLYKFEDARDALTAWLMPDHGRDRIVGRRHVHRRSVEETSNEIRYELESINEPKAITMRAILSELHNDHVPALLYVAPVNVERLRKDGISPQKIADRVERLRSVIGASAEEWLDLHGVVPEALFRDERNHLRYEGCAIVGSRIARRIRSMVEVDGQGESGAR